MPFQKGPCGEGGRMRGFLLPLMVLLVVVLVLLLIFFGFWFAPSSHNIEHQSKQKFLRARLARSRAKAFALDGPVEEERCEWKEKRQRIGMVLLFFFVCFSNPRQLLCYGMDDSQLQ